MREIIGYLLAIVLFAAGAIGVYDFFNQGDAANKVQTLQNQHLALFTGLKKKYQAQNSLGYGTAAISAQNMILWGIVPTAMQASSTSMANGWGGSVTVTGNTTSVFVDEDQIPQEACIALMSETPAGTGVIQIGAAAAGTTPTTLRTVPVSPAQATADCANTSNQLRFVMR